MIYRFLNFYLQVIFQVLLLIFPISIFSYSSYSDPATLPASTMTCDQIAASLSKCQNAPAGTSGCQIVSDWQAVGPHVSAWSELKSASNQQMNTIYAFGASAAVCTGLCVAEMADVTGAGQTAAGAACMGSALASIAVEIAADIKISGDNFSQFWDNNSLAKASVVMAPVGAAGGAAMGAGAAWAGRASSAAAKALAQQASDAAGAADAAKQASVAAKSAAKAAAEKASDAGVDAASESASEGAKSAAKVATKQAADLAEAANAAEQASEGASLAAKQAGEKAAAGLKNTVAGKVLACANAAFIVTVAALKYENKTKIDQSVAQECTTIQSYASAAIASQSGSYINGDSAGGPAATTMTQNAVNVGDNKSAADAVAGNDTAFPSGQLAAATAGPLGKVFSAIPNDGSFPNALKGMGTSMDALASNLSSMPPGAAISAALGLTGDAAASLKNIDAAALGGGISYSGDSTGGYSGGGAAKDTGKKDNPLSKLFADKEKPAAAASGKEVVFSERKPAATTASSLDIWHSDSKNSIFQIVSSKINQSQDKVVKLEWVTPLNRALNGLSNDKNKNP